MQAGGWSSVTMIKVYTQALRLQAFETYSRLAKLMNKPIIAQPNEENTHARQNTQKQAS